MYKSKRRKNKPEPWKGRKADTSLLSRGMRDMTEQEVDHEHATATTETV